MKFYENTYYHLYNRTNNEEALFRSEENYLFFLKKYPYYLDDYLETIGYCLMPTHFHFLVKVRELQPSEGLEPSEGLSIINRKIGTLLNSYTQAFNKMWSRHGNLFIIEFYINSTTPVGSEVIVRKYKIRCSPATVRNEMARLIDEGFLEMLHTSSGRVPTPMAYRFFLTDLMEEEELPVLQEIALKQRLWPSRFDFNSLVRNSVMALADVTKELAFITDAGFVMHSGAVNILDNPEFWDIDAAKAALYLLDRYELLEQVFSKAPNDGEVKFVIGNEIGNANLKNASIVFSSYNVGGKNGFIGILGPSRMRYSNVVPAVKYAKSLIEELGESW
jgi:transcriptional regulator of heat shock response